jgi:hypothetical protein
MKNIILTFLLMLMTLTGKTQNWSWAVNTTGNATGVVNALCTDPGGNIFEAGYFIGSTINFGSVSLTKLGSPNVGSGCFIAKYDATGAVLWATSFGGTSYDMIRGGCTDAQGNFYVTGSLGANVVTIGTVTLTGGSFGGSIFLAKFDPNGNTLWARRYVGTNVDEGTGVCVDGQGNPCISAHVASANLVMGTFTVSGSGSTSAVIAKFDSSGNLLWVKQTINTGMGAEGHAIACDGAGNFFMAGHFMSPSLNFGLFSLTRTGNQDAFLAKYDNSGTALWARSTTGFDLEFFRSLAVDGAGNAYVLGSYSSSIVTLGTFTLYRQALEDVMLAKYDASGTVQWAKQVSGNSRDVGQCVAVNGNRVFFTGSMGSHGYAPAGAVTMGTLTLGPQMGYTDPMFLIQLDLNGNIQYATGLASGGYNRSMVCVDNDCRMYLGSNYYNMTTPMVIGSNTLSFSYNENVFLARMDFSCPAVGLGDLSEEESGIRLYPNPSSGEFRIDLPQGEGRLELEVYTLLGQKVYQQTLQEGTCVIRTTSLAGGVYHYKLLKNSTSIKTGKLMMQ